MSDNLTDALGKSVAIEIGGKSYQISPITIGDMAALEAKLKGERLSLFLANSAGLVPAERQNIIVRLCTSAIDEESVAAAMSSLDGVRFLLWKSLSKKQPKTTIEDVSELVNLTNINEVATILQALGTGEATNPPVVEEGKA